MRTVRQRDIAIVTLLLAFVFAWPSFARAEEAADAVGCILKEGTPDPCGGGLLQSARFVIDRPFLDAFNAASEVAAGLELDLKECEERAAKAEEEKEGPGWGTVVLTASSMAAVGFAIGLFLGAGL